MSLHLNELCYPADFGPQKLNISYFRTLASLFSATHEFGHMIGDET